MMPSLRTVNCLPLTVLWDDDGDLEAIRERWLSKSDLAELLRKCPVEFIVTDVGHPLRRVGIGNCYEFWKSDARVHLVDDRLTEFELESFPGQYAFVASEWSGQIQTPIVLLEKHH